MLTVEDKFPAFALKACVSCEHGKEFEEITDHSYAGKWLVIFFWPMDFTFVCPTEISEFGRNNTSFESKGAIVLGASVDSHNVHLAWRNHHKDLKDLPFPMLSDMKRELSSALGILRRDGVNLRATFIVDPEGIIRWVNVNDADVGRSVQETLRVLDALQIGEMTPCDWNAGLETLKI